jgi:DNA-binding response OmpR family regulator
MTRETQTIIVADRDAATRAFLADNLTADGYDVLVASCPAEVSARASRGPVALLVLGDFERLGASVALLREIRAGDGLHGQPDPALPVLVLTGEGGKLAVLRSLDSGADDALGKPFSYPILRARIATVLRRAGGRVDRPVQRVGELAVDRTAREVRLRGQRLDLSAKEFALLSVLIGEPTRVFTKDELLRDVWTFRSPGRTRTLDSHACRLRSKLGAVAGDRFVVNEWGVWYRLVDAVPATLGRAA